MEKLLDMLLEIGIVHNDIHDGNVMIMKLARQRIRVGLIDYGRSSYIDLRDQDMIEYGKSIHQMGLKNLASEMNIDVPRKHTRLPDEETMDRIKDYIKKQVTDPNINPPSYTHESNDDSEQSNKRRKR